MKVAYISLIAFVFAVDAASAADITVYHDPRCTCCVAWMKHLHDHGFNVAREISVDMEDVRESAHVPVRFRSCHTAVVDGYVIEGHVPAADIRRLLKERPPLRMLAVPDMPEGSPGMEGPNPEPFDTLAITTDGEVYVYASHNRQ